MTNEDDELRLLTTICETKQDDDDDHDAAQILGIEEAINNIAIEKMKGIIVISRAYAIDHVCCNNSINDLTMVFVVSRRCLSQAMQNQLTCLYCHNYPLPLLKPISSPKPNEDYTRGLEALKEGKHRKATVRQQSDDDDVYNLFQNYVRLQHDAH